MIRELAQGIDGAVSIAYHLPGQVMRTAALLPESDRQRILKHIKDRLCLGSDMNYYYDAPQLFKMPARFRSMAGTCGCGGPCCQGMGELGAGTFKKALPFLAGAAVLYLLINRSK